MIACPLKLLTHPLKYNGHNVEELAEGAAGSTGILFRVGAGLLAAVPSLAPVETALRHPSGIARRRGHTARYVSAGDGTA